MTRLTPTPNDPHQYAAFKADPKHWLEIQEWKWRVKDAFWRGLMAGIGIGMFGFIFIRLAIENWPW